MTIENINFTPKAFILLKYAFNIAKEDKFNTIHPIHLFLAAMKIDCEVNNELKSVVSLEDIRNIKYKLNSSTSQKVLNDYIQIKDKNSRIINISQLTKDILLQAKRVTELYEEHGQIFVNDGQILRAVLNCDEEVTKQCLSSLDKDLILSIIASPRDMMVNLDNNFNSNCIENVSIRKVTDDDKNMVREFVLNNFYERWTKTIDYGLTLDDIPIYIALIDNNIVGFAGYNISKQRKGYFGPLGVLRVHRDRGIGQGLLNACLIDMKRLGFKTCIIGNASSIEFYKKACGAKIVPIVK